MIGPMLMQAAGLMEAGRLGEAEAACRQILVLHPGQSDALHLRGLIACRRGAFKEAAADLALAAGKQPKNPDIRLNYGNALAELGRLDEAAGEWRQVLRLRPDSVEAMASLGWALVERDKFDLARPLLDKVLRLRPDLPAARLNLGRLLQKTGDPRAALPHYEKLLATLPPDGVLLNNYALALRDVGRKVEAAAAFERSFALAPPDEEARLSYAELLLQVGRLQEGWQWWESRIGSKEGIAPRYRGKEWNGGRVGRLLVWSEQGVGDQIIYGSMLGELGPHADHVAFEVDPRLVTLFQRSLPGLNVLPIGEAPRDPDAFDAQIPLSSLGRFLRTSFADFPPSGRYLHPDPERLAAFRSAAPAGGLRIGTAWRSSGKLGALKSIALRQMVGALDFTGVHIFDLQYGDTREERRVVGTRDGPAAASFQHVEGLDLMDDFEGVAALAGSCDLVVTTSNAVAHIAAATGVPVWVVLPWAEGRFWYWRCEGERNPWYPEARLFVADPDRGWAGALDSVRAALGALLAERT